MADNTVVEMGDKVKDSISGFSGIVTAITQWMYGCRRITVQPDKLSKDGTTMEALSFDEPQLTIVKRAKIPAKIQASRAATGGPRPEPNRGR